MSTEIAVPLVNHIAVDGVRVPFTNDAERQSVNALEGQRQELDKQSREISQKLLAAQSERIEKFMDKAAVALGLNAEQSKDLKPLFLRFLKNLSNLQGVDIAQKAQDESTNNLLFTLLGGFIGALVMEDSRRENKLSSGVIDSRRNLDKFENQLMEKLNLKEGSGKAEVRQKMLSFLEKEFPEAAKSYRALAEVKVFDPLHGIMTWLSSVLGGKENLKSIAQDVKKDLDNLLPSMVTSVISGDDTKVKQAGEQAIKRLSAKYTPAMSKVTEAAKGVLESENLNKIIKNSLEAVRPALKPKIT